MRLCILVLLALLVLSLSQVNRLRAQEPLKVFVTLIVPSDYETKHTFYVKVQNAEPISKTNSFIPSKDPCDRVLQVEKKKLSFIQRMSQYLGVPLSQQGVPIYEGYQQPHPTNRIDYAGHSMMPWVARLTYDGIPTYLTFLHRQINRLWRQHCDRMANQQPWWINPTQQPKTEPEPVTQPPTMSPQGYQKLMDQFKDNYGWGHNPDRRPTPVTYEGFPQEPFK